MRMLKKGGSTPCDRRLDRRKVAIAAAAALLMIASAAQAQTDFVIDPTQSWIGIQHGGFQSTDGSGNFNAPFQANASQNSGLVNGGSIPNGSLDASINGHVFATVNPGSIQLFSPNNGVQIGQPNVANYQPGENSLLQPVPSTVGPGALGARVAALGAFSRQWGSTYDSPASYTPASYANFLATHNPAVLVPNAIAVNGSGNFDETGINLPQIAGIQDIVSAIASPARINLAGNQISVNFSQTYANGVTSGGADGHGANDTFVPGTGNISPSLHLVLPINLTFWSRVTSGGNLIGYLVSTAEGQIVADPAVPEPATVTLFGFGVAGLLIYAWRARKRKALVA